MSHPDPKLPQDILATLEKYGGWRNVISALDSLAACQRDAKLLEMVRWERDHAQACLERAARHLSAIYSVMNPELTRLEDGRVFRFVNPLATEYLDALSKRIREIPRELAAIDAALHPGEAG